MKKLLSLIIMLCCMISAMATVKIGSTTLQDGTEYSKTNLSAISKGYATLNGTTLSLNNATISSTLPTCIWSDEDLTIVLSGTSRLYCPNIVIYVTGNLTILKEIEDRNPILYINESYDSCEFGISCTKKLTISNVSNLVVNAKNAINSAALTTSVVNNEISIKSSVMGGILSFENSIVMATRPTSNTGHAIYGFSKVTYTGCYISTPVCVTYETKQTRNQPIIKYGWYTCNDTEINQLSVSQGTDNIPPTFHEFEIDNVSSHEVAFVWNLEDNMTSKKNIKLRYAIYKVEGEKETEVSAQTIEDASWDNFGDSSLEPSTNYRLHIEAEDAAGNITAKNYNFTTKAPEEYDLIVKGVRVTELNCDNILKDDVLNDGKFSYNPGSGILFVNNALITDWTDNEPLIYIFGSESKAIMFSGSNNLASSVHTIYTTCDLTIEGQTEDAYIYNIVNASGLAINASNSNVIIKNCKCEFNSDLYGTNTSALTIDNATVKVPRIRAFTDVTLENGVEVISPAGATYDTTKGYFSTTDNVQAEQLWIGVNHAYDLKIAGIQVTTANQDDILGDGKVSFDGKTNTLTLNNANIQVDATIIENNIPGLEVKLKGVNFLFSQSFTYSTIVSNGTIKFVGKESGTIDQGYDKNTLYAVFYYDQERIRPNIQVNDGDLYVTRCKIEGDNIWCQGEGHKLYLNDAGLAYAMVKGFDDIDYGSTKPCFIAQPSDAYYDTTKKVTVDESGNECKVNIRPITLYVTGIAVTPANANNILGDGTVSYDFPTYTLTLNNANINFDNNYIDGIETTTGLKIKLIGNNTIKYTGSKIGDYTALISSEYASIDIIGPGTLDMSGLNFGIFSWAGEKTTITNCNLSIATKIQGIQTGGSIIINGSNVKLSKEDSEGYCIGTNNLELINCVTEKPKDTYYYVWSHDIDEVIIKSTIGDVNGDGKIDACDMAILIEYLKSAGSEASTPEHIRVENVDIDFSKVVDADDVEELEKLILNK